MQRPAAVAAGRGARAGPGPQVAILRATDLTAARLAELDQRVDAPEHRRDRGACLFWHRDAARPRLFVGVLRERGDPIGIVHVDGPLNHLRPAWWLDSRFRGQGLGAAMVDALAAVLKADGYSGVGRVAIDSFGGEYDQASAALARRLRAHFP